MIYNKEITDRFLVKYKELENLQTNENDKYQYLLSKFRAELDMFRHMRNDLSHNVVDEEYPFVVSSSCLEMLENMLDKVKEKVYQFSIKRNKMIVAHQTSSIGEVISFMSKYHYSYLPIIDEKEIVIGIISSDSIIDLFNNNEDFHLLLKKPVSNFMDYFSIKNNENAFFLFIKKDMYFYELKNLINTYYHDQRKLGIIFVTENGNFDEHVIGMLTPWDVLKNQD